MDAKEKKRLLEKVEKLKPKPIELPSGKWRCQIMVKGQRISVMDDDPFVAHAKVIAQKAGIVGAAQKDRITLGEAAQQYISAREAVLSPPTIRGYKIILEQRCLDLQKRPVMDINEADLQNEISKLFASLSYKSVKNTIGFYLAVITMYNKDINTKKLNYGQKPKQEHAYLEEDEIVKIISASVGDQMEIPILLALWLGMRRSEICGLSWENVDFEQKEIRVVSTKLANSDNEYVIVDRTKTEGSRRTIDCPNYILSKLEQMQPVKAKRIGPVFDLHPNSIYRGIKRISESAGVKFVGVHGLRHTNATVMASLGLVDKAVMARGGWSSDRILKDVYEHLFATDKTDADKAINEYFEAAIPILHRNCTE